MLPSSQLPLDGGWAPASAVAPPPPAAGAGGAAGGGCHGACAVGHGRRGLRRRDVLSPTLPEQQQRQRGRDRCCRKPGSPFHDARRYTRSRVLIELRRAFGSPAPPGRLLVLAMNLEIVGRLPLQEVRDVVAGDLAGRRLHLAFLVGGQLAVKIDEILRQLLLLRGRQLAGAFERHLRERRHDGVARPRPRLREHQIHPRADRFALPDRRQALDQLGPERIFVGRARVGRGRFEQQGQLRGRVALRKQIVHRDPPVG